MTDLSEFLLARIAEDERRLDLPDYGVVRNSDGQVSARGDGWVTRGECPVCGAYQFDGTESVTEEAWWEHAETVHQRTRVLAECEAKRAIVGLAAWTGRKDSLRDRLFGPAADEAFQQGIKAAMRLLALPYADHPDYDQAWRP